MPLTETQKHLASIIDGHVEQIIQNDDEDLLVSMYDHMDTQYYAKLLELLAEGIADGTIPVPQ